MDTFEQLKQLWKPKHLKHLQYCLKYCQAYFEDNFEYERDTDDGVIINGEVFTAERIVEELAQYYVDDNSHYQSEFGDTLYLFFTDLVEDDVDILRELDEEVA